MGMTALSVVDKPDGLLSIEAAATWLDVSVSTVKRLLAAGHLPYVRIPDTRLRRIHVDALREFVQTQGAAVTPRRRLRTATSSTVV